MPPHTRLSIPAVRNRVIILLYGVYAGLALYDIYLDNHDPYPRMPYEGFTNIVFLFGVLLPLIVMNRDHPGTVRYRSWLCVVQIDCLLICIALVGYAVYTRLASR